VTDSDSHLATLTARSLRNSPDKQADSSDATKTNEASRKKCLSECDVTATLN